MTTDPFFVENDEETLSYFLSASKEEITSSQLGDLAKRIHGDYNSSSEAILIDNRRKLQDVYGIVISNPPSFPGITGAEEGPFPAAFGTEEGKKHLKAVSALLHVSETTAVKLSLGAMRSVSSKGSEFQRVLGTRAFLLTVLKYHLGQRIARLTILAECLRAELDESSPSADRISSMLDTLDGLVKVGNRNRGIFYFLLSTICQAERALDREELSPAKELKRSNPNSMLDSLKRPSEEFAWNEFMLEVASIKRDHVQRERLEALEGLLALLYDRIDGGVHRADFAQILVGFQSVNHFFAAKNLFPSRVPKLAGFICVECMGFWRVFDKNDKSPSGWVSSHPMYDGIEYPLALREFEGLIRFLNDLAEQTYERKLTRLSELRLTSSNPGVNQLESPEGLAVLSLGLLLRAGQLSRTLPEIENEGIIDALGENGVKLVELANHKCECFDYLFSVLDHLVATPTCVLTKTTKTVNGNEVLWMPCGDTAKEDDLLNIELSAPSLVCASVGRELVSVVVLVFKDVVLNPKHSALLENISMLTNLISVVFKNSAILCERFWSEWDEYTSPVFPGSRELFPICQVLDFAYTLAVSAAESSESYKDDEVIIGVAPLIRLVSSMVSDSVFAEVLIPSLLPAEIIQVTVRALGRRFVDWGSGQLVQSCKTIVDALCDLTMVAGPEICRSLLDDGNTAKELVSALFQIVVAAQSEESSSKTVALISALLDGSSLEWALHVAEALNGYERAKASKRCLSFSDTSKCSMVSIFTALTEHLDSITSSTLPNDEDMVGFLEFLGNGVASSLSVLSSEFTSSGLKPSTWGASAVKLSSTITDTTTTFLNCINFISVAHTCVAVRECASEMLSILLSTLCTNEVGQAVFLCAALPITLSITISMAEMSDEHDVYLLLAKENSPSVPDVTDKGMDAIAAHEDPRTRRLLDEIIGSINDVRIDMDLVLSRCRLAGCIETDLTKTAVSALRLIRTWSQCAEDVLSRQIESDMAEDLYAISPYRFLAHDALPPPTGFLAGDVLGSGWRSISVTNFSLLARFLHENESFDPEGILSIATYDAFCDFAGHANACHQTNDSDKCFSRLVQESVVFQNAIRRYMLTANSVVGWRLLRALRSYTLFQNCVSGQPALAVSLLGEDARTLRDYIHNHIGSASEKLVREQSLRSDELRLLAAQLSTVAVIRTSVRRIRAPHNSCSEQVNLYLEDSEMLLTHIAHISLDLNISNPCVGEGTIVESSLFSTLQQLCISSGLDILSNEVAWHIQVDSLKQSPVVKALENVWEKDMARFIPAMERLLEVRLVSTPSNSLSKWFMVARLNLDNVQAHLLPSATVTSTLEASLLPRSGSIARTLMRYAMSSSDDSTRQQSMVEKVHEFYACACLLTAQIRRTTSCVLFTGLLIDAKRLNPNSTFNSLHVQARFDMGCAVAATLSSNLLLFRNMNTEQQSYIYLKTMLEMACGHAGLLCTITATFEAAGQKAGEAERSLLNTIETCFRLFPKSVFADVRLEPSPAVSLKPIYFLTQQRMLTSLLGMVLYCSKLDGHDNIPAAEIYTQVCCRACEELTDALHLPGPVGETRSLCIRVSLSLLATLLSKLLNMETCNLFGVDEVLRRFGTAHSLGLICTGMFGEGVAKDNVSTLRLSALSILVTIVASENPDMVNLIADGDALCFLGKEIPSLRQTEGLTLGTRERSDRDAERVFLLLATLLRATFSSPNETRDRARSIALNFIKSNVQALVDRLMAVSSSSLTANISGFTLNSMYMASLVLDVVSEMCRHDIFDHFRRMCKESVRQLLQLARTLTATLAKFLGASSTSRELFWAVKSFQDEVAMVSEQGARLAPMNPVFQALSGGLPNATHEAIRYSYYVERLSGRPSEHENDLKSSFPNYWKPQRTRATSDPNSQSSLERAAREEVSNNLMFQLERQAARCVYFNLLIIWRMHPASRSFTPISDVDTVCKVPTEFIKPGVVVAFRNVGRNKGYWRTLTNTHTYPDRFGEVSFGEVIETNTVERIWRVRLVGDSEGSEWCVPDFQLCGIEDVTRRTTTLSISPAPDSTAELYEDNGSLSIGHLILILRWCRQYQAEATDFRPEKLDVSHLPRLAELACALLGLELSLHNVVGTEIPQKMKLNYQVLDLFDSTVGQWFQSLSDGRYSGLETILSTKSYIAIKQQLSKELEEAIQDLQSQHKIKSQHVNAISGQRWVGSIRRTSSNSPFRGLGM